MRSRHQAKLNNAWVVVLSVVALLPLGRIQAQTSTGTILGTVTDNTGAVVPDAKVTSIQMETSARNTVVSNSLGYFEIPFLLPGKYQVIVEYAGFDRFVRQGLTLDTDQRINLSVSLQPGQVQQTVTVSGETPLLDTSSSSVGQVIDNTSVVNLPLSNRNLLQITGLVAGVIDRGADAAPATTGSIGFSHWGANGSLSGTNAFALDGANAMNGGNGAPTIIPTIDVVDQYKIMTSSMSAEWGRTGGAVIAVTTKAGTNSLHGTVYEFWQNRVLNANTWVNNSKHLATPFTNVSVFGASLGGPVIVPRLVNGKNRLFFFANFEGYRGVIPTPETLTVPTAAEHTGDFSQLMNSSGKLIAIYDPTTTAAAAGSSTQYTRKQFSYNGTPNVIPPDRINATAAAMMSYYPLPNTTPTNSLTQVNNYYQNPPSYDYQDQWSVRVDDNLSESKRLFVRYIQSTKSGEAVNYFPDSAMCSECALHGNPAGVASSPLYIYAGNAAVGYTQTLTSKTILDIRVSMNRQFLKRISESTGFDLTSIGMSAPWQGSLSHRQFPPTSIANYAGLGSGSNGDLFLIGDTTGDFDGSITRSEGAHTIKAGGDYRIFRVNGFQVYNNSPTFSFDQTWTQQNPFASSSTAGWGLASFLVGTPASGSVTLPYESAWQWFYFAGFAQDDWRVTKRLTLNLGIRYNLETPFTEKNNASQYFSPTGTTVLTAAYPSAVGGLVFVGKDTSSRYENPIDWTNVEPRLGAALRVTDSLVWRGGYGMFYGPVNTLYSWPNAATVDLGFSSTTSMVTSSDGGLTPAGYFSNPFPVGLVQPTNNSLGLMTYVGQAVSAQLRNVVTPYNQQYNTGFEYQWKSFFFAASYVGSHGVHQIVKLPLSQLPDADFALGSALNKQVANPFYGLITSGSLATSTVSAGQLLRPFPQFTGVTNQFSSSGNLNYNSLQLTAEHRFSRGFSYLVNYTWSKNIGNVGDFTRNLATVQDQYNLRAERAISTIDVPTAFTAAWTWKLPVGRDGVIGTSLPAFANILLSGWQTTGDYTFNSGNPLAITNSVNVVAFGAGSRPNWNGQNPTLPSAKRTAARWFNTSDFFTPSQYTFGNTPPYMPQLRSAHTNTWNLGFFKDVLLGEHITAQVRAEMYNAFNHPVWATPGTVVGSSSFGVVSGKNGNRTGQLAAKIIF